MNTFTVEISLTSQSQKLKAELPYDPVFSLLGI